MLPFIELYTAGVEDAEYCVPAFSVLMVICGTLRCFQLCYQMIIQAAGKFKETQVAAAVEPIINIAVSIALVMKYDLVGVAIGTVVSLSYRLGYMVWYLQRAVLQRPIKLVLKQLSVDIIDCVVIVLTTLFLPQYASNYFGWAMNALIISIIAFIGIIPVNYVFYKPNVSMLFHRVCKRKS